jgi:hypothetical protein
MCCDAEDLIAEILSNPDTHLLQILIDTYGVKRIVKIFWNLCIQNDEHFRNIKLDDFRRLFSCGIDPTNPKIIHAVIATRNLNLFREFDNEYDKLILENGVDILTNYYYYELIVYLVENNVKITKNIIEIWNEVFCYEVYLLLLENDYVDLIVECLLKHPINWSGSDLANLFMKYMDTETFQKIMIRGFNYNYRLTNEFFDELHNKWYLTGTDMLKIFMRKFLFMRGIFSNATEILAYILSKYDCNVSDDQLKVDYLTAIKNDKSKTLFVEKILPKLLEYDYFEI